MTENNPIANSRPGCADEEHKRAARRDRCWQGQARAAQVAVVVTLLGLGGCVSPAHHDAYKLTTKDGPVLIELENGFTRSYPCSVLYKLAVRGISDAGIGVVQFVGAVDLPTAELKLNVTENQLRPAASEITASRYRYGVLQKTVRAAVPAPGAAPQAVFLYSVSSLARRLMSNETDVFPTV